MQNVRKRKPVSRRNTRLTLLCAAALLLMAAIGVTLLLEQNPPAVSVPVSQPLSITLADYAPEEVASITIRRGNDPIWTAVQAQPLCLTIQGDEGFSLSAEESSGLLEAACNVIADDVLTDDPSAYAAQLAEYGLDNPRYWAEIVYSDGETLTLHVGSASQDGTWRYMLASGDDRLFALSRGAVDALFVNRDTLREIAQPTLHKARVDRITLSGPDGVIAQWTLLASVAADDAIDHWQITQPFAYPADATAMQALLDNIGNLRLGAYVCPATPEALALYGFDQPRLAIDLHMAAATIGSVDSEGVYVTKDWPAASCTFVIGGEKSDLVDYILYEDAIYISSRFTMGMFLSYDVTETMSRYLVHTALGNLAALSIEENGNLTEYRITRTEQVAANNSLVTDALGNPVLDFSLTRNGMPTDYTAFEAAYSALLPITVSGKLPGPTIQEPHTIYTFTDVNGTVRTLAFATYDALHDAVIIDGHQAFYLIKGGFSFPLK